MGDTATLTLAASLDLTAAPGLRQDIAARLAEGPLVLDAGAVARIASPCFEVLAAAAQSGKLHIAPVSAAFGEAARALGLCAVLGLEGGDA